FLLPRELMGLFNFVRGKLRRSPASALSSIEWRDEGVAIRFTRPLPSATIDAILDAADHSSAEETFLVAYLSQLASEDRCRLTTEAIFLPWELVYELRTDKEHAGAVQSLGLP